MFKISVVLTCVVVLSACEANKQQTQASSSNAGKTKSLSSSRFNQLRKEIGINVKNSRNIRKACTSVVNRKASALMSCVLSQTDDNATSQVLARLSIWLERVCEELEHPLPLNTEEPDIMLTELAEKLVTLSIAGDQVFAAIDRAAEDPSSHCHDCYRHINDDVIAQFAASVEGYINYVLQTNQILNIPGDNSLSIRNRAWANLLRKLLVQ